MFRSGTNGGTMKRLRFAPALILIAAVTSAAGAPVASPPQLHTVRIEELTGAKGKLDEKEGAFKVSVPRGDLDVRVAGARMTPPMGLTSWASFKRIGRHTVVMGDMVLLEDQVNPVMSIALDNSLEVTGLHNHFLGGLRRIRRSGRDGR